MPINLTYTNFLNKVARDDFARNNLFRVLTFDCRGIQLSEDDLLYCNGGALPGRTNGQGITQYMGVKIPYVASTAQYPGNEDYVLEFKVDANCDLLRQLEIASRTEFNDITSTGDWRAVDLSNIITLVALDKKLEPIEYIKLYGVAFKSFDAIDTKAADGDGTLITVKVHVSFVYYRRGGSDTVYAEA